eukprot:c18487_g1_i1 orf=445-2136(+)
MMQMYHLKIIQSIYLHLQPSLFKTRRNRDVVDQEGDKRYTDGPAYESAEMCHAMGRESQAVVAELNGTITRSKSPFPYYMLVAFEAGSPIRGLILLLFWPLIWVLHTMVSEAASIHMFIFISMVGLKERDLEGVGRAVLCRFYLEDMNPHSYKVFLLCGRRCVVTCNPRVMVEPFLKEYLGVDLVLGTELHTLKGFCTGLVKGPGVLVGKRKRDAVKRAFPHALPDLGLASHPTASAFLSLCKEGYIVTGKQVEAVPKEEYRKPLIFHDGRLALRPTPMASVFIYLWLPIGLILSVIRLMSWIVLPSELSVPLGAFLGVRVRVKGAPPLPKEESGVSRGALFVCTHRTLLDPIFLSIALRRRVAAVTYSLSRLSEVIAPLKTVRLTRNREEDATTIDSLLKHGDVVICPEGTTCREPYLLRFSPLFAEITNDIVPAGTEVSMTLFHGTTARGCKGMDPFYFLMNPFPGYNVTILEPLPKEETCASGKSSVQVANGLQKVMGSVMGYQCTTLTRKDKYRTLAGNDGLVPTTVDIPTKKSLLSFKKLCSSICNHHHFSFSSKLQA